MKANMPERRFRIGGAVVFGLIALVVVIPLFDSDQRTTLDRTLRIIGGIVLILLAALSMYGPGRRRDRT
jgi:uncharacterized membrane protein